MEKEILQHLWVAIIAGGQGTRLFPLSHKGCPKQFCNVDSKHKFIQSTIKRFTDLGIKPNHVVVITTNDNQTKLAYEQTASFGVLRQNIYQIEPTLDFAGAMVAATEFILTLDEDAVVINSPADQYIIADEAFTHAIDIAVDYGQYDPTIIGVKATDLIMAKGCGHALYDPNQETDFEVEREDMAFFVTGFVEKPGDEEANRLMRQDCSVCNTGITVWPAKMLLGSIITTKEIGPGGLKTDVLMNMIMAKKYSLRVVAGTFSWYDCGTLKSLFEISKKTPNHKNASLGEGIIERTDCRRSLFYAAEGIHLRATGIEDCAALANVIDERIVITIVKLSESQRVKQLAEDYEANKSFLTDDFAVGARNNFVMRTNFSKEVRVGFVGVDNFIVYSYKHHDGTIDVAVSQQSQF